LFLEYWTLPAIRTIDLPLVAPKIPIYVTIQYILYNPTIIINLKIIKINKNRNKKVFIIVIIIIKNDK